MCKAAGPKHYYRYTNTLRRHLLMPGTDLRLSVACGCAAEVPSAKECVKGSTQLHLLSAVSTVESEPTSCNAAQQHQHGSHSDESDDKAEQAGAAPSAVHHMKQYMYSSSRLLKLLQRWVTHTFRVNTQQQQHIEAAATMHSNQQRMRLGRASCPTPRTNLLQAATSFQRSMPKCNHRMVQYNCSRH